MKDTQRGEKKEKVMEREIQRRNGDRQRKGEKNTQRKIQTDKQQEKKIKIARPNKETKSHRYFE